MSFDKHVSEICKASYFHIPALRHIRSSLTTEAAKTVAVAIVGSLSLYICSLTQINYFSFFEILEKSPVSIELVQKVKSTTQFIKGKIEEKY